MDASSIKNELIQMYRNKMSEVIPHRYHRKMNDEVIAELDKAVSIMAAERDFILLTSAISMQAGWLNSTRYLVGILADLGMLPDTNKAVKKAFSEAPSGFQESFKSFTRLIGRESRAEQIVKDLRTKKEDCICRVHWKLFLDDDYHSPDVERLLLQHFDGGLASIPGTVAYELIAMQQQLYKLFPELRDADLESELAEYRLQFLADKSLSEMDDFRVKIIQIFKQLYHEGVMEDLLKETKEQIRCQMAKVDSERFV